MLPTPKAKFKNTQAKRVSNFDDYEAPTQNQQKLYIPEIPGHLQILFFKNDCITSLKHKAEP